MGGKEDLEWLKENCKLFLDQNINLEIESSLKAINYKNISDVYSIGFKGANDGKLLKLIKEKKFILITHDYHFYRMAEKYIGLVIFIDYNKKYRGVTSSNFIQNYLVNKFKLIKKYYETS
jgi:hypothetical protein